MSIVATEIGCDEARDSEPVPDLVPVCGQLVISAEINYENIALVVVTIHARPL